MSTIIYWFNSFIILMKTFSVSDFFDIIITSFIIYQFIKLIRENRASHLVKGIIILVIGYFLASKLDFLMLKYLLTQFFEFAVITFIVVFQPELRNALEQIGRSNIGKKFNYIATSSNDNFSNIIKIQNCLNVIVDAVMALQKTKTGALIVLERETRLGDIIKTGTIIDAAPSASLIGNIFFNKAPLHDGALIIRNKRVYAAGCILPLTVNKNVNSELGTRHRAALGISENSDAVTIIVSEETGVVSIAMKGIITRDYDKKLLRDKLYSLFISSSEEISLKKHILKSLKRFKYNGNKKV